MYIIVQICVKTLTSSVIGCYSTETEGIAKLFEYLKHFQKNKNMNNKLNGPDRFEITEINNGYIYGSYKNLKYVVQLLQVDYKSDKIKKIDLSDDDINS